MPLALIVRKTDRAKVEPVAQKLQRRAFKQTDAMGAAILASMKVGQASVDMKALVAALASASWSAIKAEIPELTQPARLTKDDRPTPAAPTTLEELIQTTYGDASSFALSMIPRFDLVDTNAVDYARTRAGKLLTDLNGDALANAREAVAFGMENGLTVGQTAKFLQQSLYLPPRGRTAVNNYFKALVARLNEGDSLDEAARAAGKTRALSPKQFLDATNTDTLVQRYSDRWVKYTAETQARTLTIEASNGGLIDGWNQAAEKGYFDPSTATLVWYATDDDITCPICEDLNDTDCPFDDPGWGDIDFPPAHPDCRCTVVLITPSGIETEVDDASDLTPPSEPPDVEAEHAARHDAASAPIVDDES